MKLIILLYFIFIPLIISAQIFTKKSSIRVYEYNGFWSQGITIMYFEKDTIINGNYLSKYNLFANWQQRGPGGGIYKNKVREIYFNDTLNRLSYYDEWNKKLIPIIDFNITLQDSIDFHFDMSGKPSLSEIVDTTFIKSFNSKILKTQAIRFKYNNFFDPIWYKRDTSIERIGFISDFILPWDYLERQVDGGVGGRLLCYYDDTVGQIDFIRSGELVFGHSCANWVNSIDEFKPQSNRFSISPNPCLDRLNVYTELPNTFSIYNQNGKKELTFNLKAGIQSLDLSGLETGLYFTNTIGQGMQKLIKIAN